MNNSIQSISTRQVSFKGLHIKENAKINPSELLKKHHFDSFQRNIESLNHIDVIFDQEGVEIIKKFEEKKPDISHRINLDAPFSKYMNKTILNFKDGSYIFNNAGIKLEKYGKSMKQKLLCLIESATESINEPKDNFTLINLFGKFSK